MKLEKNENDKPLDNRVTDKEVEEAFVNIIKWIGEDPSREGLKSTPKRLMKAYKEYFKGYNEDPKKILNKTFGDVQGYDDMVIQKNISLQSHCEHHMAPIIGVAHLSYIPNQRVVGLSKLARLVEVFAKRLQIQEKLTAQIANAIDEVLQPKGVGVIIEASHLCVSTRGIHKPESRMVTSRMLGSFRNDQATRKEFLDLVGFNKSKF